MMIHTTLPDNLAHLRTLLSTLVISARRCLRHNDVTLLATETRPGRYKTGAILASEMGEYLQAWNRHSGGLAEWEHAKYGDVFAVIVPMSGNDLYLIKLDAPGALLS